MKLIYVAGRYTPIRSGQSVDMNIERARHAGAVLVAKGWAPVIPHMLTAHGEDWTEVPDGMKKYDHANDARNVFIKIGLALLMKCDAIFMLQGWQESSGACAEYNLAVALGLETYHEDEGFPHPNSTRHEPEMLEP